MSDKEYNKAVLSEKDVTIKDKMYTINEDTTIVNGNVSELTAREVLTIPNLLNVTAT